MLVTFGTQRDKVDANGEIGRNDEERDCKEGMGEGKLHFHLLKSIKRQKGPLGQSVSTNFFADCSFLILKPLPYVKAWMSAPYPPHHLNQ